MQGRLVLLDSHAILFRSFHAMPALTTPDGRTAGGVYGFANVVVRVLRELEPTWMIACFDAPGKTFREEVYPAYKATRAETPPEIIEQEPMSKVMLEGFNIPHLGVTGFEADDLLATLAIQALRDDAVTEIVIVTGDRDLLQLSQERVKIYLLRNSVKEIVLLDVQDVTALCELPPSQLLDWKALRGDPSDNIIGVPGIGDKTARQLILAHGSLEGLYQALAGTAPHAISARIGASLLEHKDRAFANRELLRVRFDAPVELDLVAAARTNYRHSQALTTLKNFGFKSILTRLPQDQTAEQGRLFV